MRPQRISVIYHFNRRDQNWNNKNIHNHYLRPCGCPNQNRFKCDFYYFFSILLRSSDLVTVRGPIIIYTALWLGLGLTAHKWHIRSWTEGPEPDPSSADSRAPSYWVCYMSHHHRSQFQDLLKCQYDIKQRQGQHLNTHIGLSETLICNSNVCQKLQNLHFALWLSERDEGVLSVRKGLYSDESFNRELQ